jgi:hypothetical protein
MALMEYCLVNIVLGDSDGPKSVPEPPKPDRVFDLAARVRCDRLIVYLLCCSSNGYGLHPYYLVTAGRVVASLFAIA